MERNKKWLDLCQSASTEQDPKKLMALVSEIVKALQDRDRKTGPVAVNMQRDAGHTLPSPGSTTGIQCSEEFHNPNFDDCSL
jgi:hypothetical protein